MRDITLIFLSIEKKIWRVLYYFEVCKILALPKVSGSDLIKFNIQEQENDYL